MTLTLTLSKEEIQAILSILTEKPYGQVYRLIAEIQRQASEQLAQGDVDGPEA